MSFLKINIDRVLAEDSMKPEPCQWDKNRPIYNNIGFNGKTDNNVAFMSISEAIKLPVGLASLTNILSNLEQRRLTDNISAVGLNYPIEIDGRGMLIDGRHRISALKSLGVETIPYMIIEAETDMELLDKLMSHEVGRDKTAIQKAFFAVKIHFDLGVKAGEAQKKTGANSTYFRTAKRIYMLDAEVAEQIYNGHAYTTLNNEVTFNLGKIEADMKRRKSIDVSNLFDGVMSSNAAEDWSSSELSEERLCSLCKAMDTVENEFADKWATLEELSKYTPVQREDIREQYKEILLENAIERASAYKLLSNVLTHGQAYEKDTIIEKIGTDTWLGQHFTTALFDIDSRKKNSRLEEQLTLRYVEDEESYFGTSKFDIQNYLLHLSKNSTK